METRPTSSMSSYVLIKKSTVVIAVCVIIALIVTVGILSGLLARSGNGTKPELSRNTPSSDESGNTDEKLVHRTVDFDEGKKVLKQISFYDYTSIWGVDPDGISYVRNNGEWVKVDGLMNHISTGPSGTWAINRNSEVLYRQGSSVYKPEGIVWSKIDGNLRQISSGQTGIVYGVDTQGNVLCRDKITCDNPLGTAWLKLKGTKQFEHVSCGGKGCYAVDKNGKVLYRKGISLRNCRGTEWVSFPENKENLVFNNIQTSASGFRVIGVTKSGKMYRRMGVNAIIKPIGTNWLKISNESYIFAEPCHIGWIGVTKSYKTKFTSAIPTCRSTSQNLTQIDTGESEATWGTYQGNAYQRQGNFWVPLVNGSFQHITTSANEIWAVTRDGDVFYRDHVTCSNPFGSSWKKIDGEYFQIIQGPKQPWRPVAGNPVKFLICSTGKLKQVDVGKVGLIYGLDKKGNVYCRSAITSQLREGQSWLRVDKNTTRKYIYVGCGEFGCWAVDDSNKIWFRVGSSKKNCAGSLWKNVQGPEFTSLESGHHGLSIGVTKTGMVSMRLGTSEMDPIGTGWIHFYNSMRHATHGQLKIYVIDNNNISYKCT